MKIKCITKHTPDSGKLFVKATGTLGQYLGETYMPTLETPSGVHVRLRNGKCMPLQKTGGSAGFDLVTAEDVLLEHNKPLMVDLGIDIFIGDPTIVGTMFIRSSLCQGRGHIVQRCRCD